MIVATSSRKILQCCLYFKVTLCMQCSFCKVLQDLWIHYLACSMALSHKCWPLSVMLGSVILKAFELAKILLKFLGTFFSMRCFEGDSFKRVPRHSSSFESLFKPISKYIRGLLRKVIHLHIQNHIVHGWKQHFRRNSPKLFQVKLHKSSFHFEKNA